MITRGEIKSIDWTSNTCNVRIPLFETVGTKDEIIMPALFCTPPGICNGYSEGDIVWVGFEFGETYSKVVILGKLFIDTNTEKNIKGSGITCADLIVKNSTILPINTKIDNYLGTDVQNTEVALTKFETLQDIITAISNQSVKITQLFENGSSKSGSTIVPNPDNTTDTLSSIGIDGINYTISGSGGGTTVNAVLYVSQGLNASQQLQARTNIGAGTSNLVLGNTASTAAAGNHTHLIQTDWNITDSTATGYIKNKPSISNITSSDISNWNGKQDQLVSGTNIKTINNQSLLGSGNIAISGGGGITEITGTGKIKLTGLSTDFGSVKWSLIGKQLIVYFYDVNLTSSPFYNTNSIFITGFPEVTFSAHNFWAYLNLDNTIWGKLIFTKTTAAGDTSIVFSPSSSSAILTSQTLKDLNNSTLTILTD